MKVVMLIVIAASLLGLGGCAASGSSLARADSMDANIDQEKIVTVNQWSRDHGATTIWVTLPTKPRVLLAKESL